MGITFTIEKKHFYVLLTILITIFGIVAVAAYQSQELPKDFGHSAEEVEVRIAGATKNLQQAIDEGSVSGAATLSCQTKIIGWNQWCHSTVNCEQEFGPGWVLVGSDTIDTVIDKFCYCCNIIP